MNVEKKPVGRKRQFDRGKDAKWREVMSAFYDSGLSARDFCRRNGIAEPSFYSWRRTLAQRDAQALESDGTVDSTSHGFGGDSRAPRRRSALAPVAVLGAADFGAAAPALEICVGSEVRIEVDSRCPAALLQQVLSTLSRTAGAEGVQSC